MPLSIYELTTHGDESNTNATVQLVQNSFKFKNSYGQIDFSPKQSLAITKTISELIVDSLGGFNLTERKPRGGNKFEIPSCPFLKAMHEVYQATTTNPHMYTSLHQGYLAKACDGGHWVLIDIISLSNLEIAGVSQDRIMKLSIIVSSL